MLLNNAIKKKQAAIQLSVHFLCSARQYMPFMLSQTIRVHCYSQYIAGDIVIIPSHPNWLHTYLPTAVAPWLSGAGWSDLSWHWAWDVQCLPHLTAPEAFKLIVLGWWDGNGIYCKILDRLQLLLLTLHFGEKGRISGIICPSSLFLRHAFRAFTVHWNKQMETNAISWLGFIIAICFWKNCRVQRFCNHSFVPLVSQTTSWPGYVMEAFVVVTDYASLDHHQNHHQIGHADWC